MRPTKRHTINRKIFSKKMILIVLLVLHSIKIYSTTSFPTKDSTGITNIGGASIIHVEETKIDTTKKKLKKKATPKQIAKIAENNNKTPLKQKTKILNYQLYNNNSKSLSTKTTRDFIGLLQNNPINKLKAVFYSIYYRLEFDYSQEDTTFSLYALNKYFKEFHQKYLSRPPPIIGYKQQEI